MLRIFLIGFIAAFTGIASLYYLGRTLKAKSEKPRRVFGLISVAMCLMFTEFMLEFAGNFYLSFQSMDDEYERRLFNILLTMLDPIVMPPFSIAVLLLVTTIKKPMMTSLILQIPIVVGVFFYFILQNENIVHIMYAYLILYLAIWLPLLHVYVFRYQRTLPETYSNFNHRDVKWVLGITYGLFFQFVLWSVLEYYFQNAYNECMYYVFSIMMWSLFIVCIDRHNFDTVAMDDVIRTNLVSIVNSNAEPESAEHSKKQDSFVVLDNKIYNFCVVQKNYLNPELNVADVAQAIGTNRTYISQWFRQHGENFSSYINNLRLQHAVALLEHSDESITSIWMNSGFGTAHSFRIVFKAKYGCSPSEYRRGS